jgi:hypothetical protein
VQPLRKPAPRHGGGSTGRRAGSAHHPEGGPDEAHFVKF